jgi:hypothetical protein
MTDKLSNDELEGLRVSEAIRQGVLIERDELRAENERLKAAVAEIGAAHAAAQIEVERLRDENTTLDALIDKGLFAEIERLRAALVESETWFRAALAESEAENDQWQKKLAEEWAEVKLLRAALDASHPHVYAKPGCRACEILGVPTG